MTSEGWAARLHSAFATIAWCCALNLLWIGFTLLGGIVLGIGPATVAACVVARRRMRGESIQIRDFAVAWRRELIRGSLVILPVVALPSVLLSNYAYFSALGPTASAPRLATLGAFVVAVGAGVYVGPMYAHYNAPLWTYPVKALRFALARPASTVVLLFVFAVLAFASAAMPILLGTVSIGAWLQTSTWLCVRFFTENEDRLANAPQQGERVLPSEPLRIR